MRLRDLSGEKEFRGARELICSRIVARDAGWKMLRSSRRVIRSVFVGGEGEDRGGIEPKSIERGERDRFADSEGEEEPDTGGEFDCC